MAVMNLNASAVLQLKNKHVVAAQEARVGGDITSESDFFQNLRREMRRTERSGRPFALALITTDGLGNENRRKVMCDVAKTIAASTRETDWLGWYEQNVTMAIVLTEIGEADESKVELLAQRISEVMQQAVSKEEFNRLRLSLKLFPLKTGESAGDGDESNFYRDLHCKQQPRRPEEIAKRAIDVVGSLFALLLFAPLFAILAALVKLTSRGPVFHCQERVGQYGALFKFYKFRSMYVNSDVSLHQDYVTQLIEGASEIKQSDGMYKLIDDPRVTRLGQFLRKSSLDELPQFFNVLRGEMTLVGPRPPLPYEVERYRMWHRRRILDIKPGLTGLWQVKGRSRTTFDEMVRMDLHYAKTQSFWLDIKIILQTPSAIFTGTGAA